MPILIEKIWSSVSIIGILLITAASILAQYQIKSWTTDDGLPQNTVASIVQTSDGYLWMTTLDGLVRFDGVRFTVFNKNNSAGILSNRFTGIIEDASGDLWIGTEKSGLTWYRDGAFQTFHLGDKSDKSAIGNLSLNEAGYVAAAAERGFYSWNGADFAADGTFGAADENTVLLRGKASGAWWLGRGQTLRRFKDGRATDFALPINKDTGLNNLVEDSRGRLWIGTTEAGLLMFENDQFTVYTTEDGLPSNHITPRTEDGNGNLWAATDQGAVIFAGDGKISRLTVRDGLSDNNLTGIYEDREGNIWIGTLYRGVNRLSRQTVAFFGTKDGLAANIAHPIFQTSGGGVWIGGAALTLFQEGVFKSVKNVGKHRFGETTAIAEDRRGRLWFGHWDGVYYLENGTVKNFNDRLGAAPAVMDIHEDRAGNLWFAADQGLFRFQNDSITRLTTADGLASNDAKVILESKTGALWVGTYGGLTRITDCGSRIADCRIVNYTTADGLASDLIRSLFEDDAGVLWIGSYDGGLTRLKDGRFTRYTSGDGLYNDGVFQILPDDGGNFWMSSNRGIYRVSKQQLNDFADGRIARIESVAYSKADGLNETECNGGQQPAGTRTGDGRLWFPTQRGVAVIDPAKITTNPFAPPVIIESAKIDNDAVSIVDPINIAPGKNNLEIVYTGLSFVKPELVSFRYKLEGQDADWIAAGTRRTAYYSYLPPGEYTFRVTAANSDGVWNDAGKTLKITVVPPLYRTWWFWIAIVFLIAGAAYLSYRQRVANLEKKQAAQRFFSQQLIESQERERQRIAGELHDGLSQSLVIIKNRAMMSLSERGNDEYVFEQIEEIVEAAGESLHEVRVIANNLRPFQIDRLGLTKAIEALVRKANSARLDVAAQLDNIDGVFEKPSEINLYRIVQESLNNIIKHSEATEARIIIRRAAGHIEITIKDDGKGFDANAPFDNESANGSGFGITGIYERARMLGTTPVIESSAGGGTTIRLKIFGAFG